LETITLVVDFVEMVGGYVELVGHFVDYVGNPMLVKSIVGIVGHPRD